jgi:hypothetical protein
VRVAAHGVAAELPAGWEGRIYARPVTAPAISPPPLAPGLDGVTEGHLATLHAANFALRGDEGEFGGEATIGMPAGGVFCSLIEYQPDDALVPGTGLFAEAEVPRLLAPADFHPDTMMAPRPGQAGVQRFFTAGARPFCLYAVLGSRRRAPELVPQLNRVLGSLVIG